MTALVALGSLLGAVVAYLLFLWNFETFDEFLRECGWRDKRDHRWRLFRGAVQPAWQAWARLVFAVIAPALLVAMALPTKLATLFA